jgi:hypothetical protein
MVPGLENMEQRTPNSVQGRRGKNRKRKTAACEREHSLRRSRENGNRNSNSVLEIGNMEQGTKTYARER